MGCLVAIAYETKVLVELLFPATAKPTVNIPNDVRILKYIKCIKTQPIGYVKLKFL